MKIDRNDNHLSALYYVQDHTNHILSESLSSDDAIDGDKELQKDKYKDKDTQTETNKKCFQDPMYAFFFQKQGVQRFKILYWLSSCDDKDKDRDTILCIF